MKPLNDNFGATLAGKGGMNKEPLGREVPPHRKRAGAKPWRMEYKDVNSGRWGYLFFPDWTPVRRYRTQADAEKALVDVKRKHADLWYARIVGPDGEVIE